MTDTPPVSPAAAPPLTPADERLWGSLAQYGNILSFIPSLLILLILGPRSAFVKDQSREALNFSITAVIGYVALAVVGAIVSALYRAAPSGIDLIFALISLLVGLAQLALWIAVIVLSIVQGLKVSRGGTARYPIALRLIK